MSEATQTSSTPTQPSIAPLVTHSRKREWGRALLLWRRDEKRAYQFEDGNMRVFELIRALLIASPKQKGPSPFSFS